MDSFTTKTNDGLIWPLVAVGIASAVATTLWIFYVSLPTVRPDSMGLQILGLMGFPFPIYGFLYGLITGIYFEKTHTKQPSLTHWLGWVIASGLSFGAALFVMLFSDGGRVLFTAPIAGFVGSLVLVLAFDSMYPGPKRANRIVILLLGALIPLLVLLAFIRDPALFNGGYVSAVCISTVFFIWQTTLTVMLSYRPSKSMTIKGILSQSQL